MDFFLRKYGKAAVLVALIALLGGVLLLGVMKDKGQGFSGEVTDSTAAPIGIDSTAQTEPEITLDDTVHETTHEAETEAVTVVVTEAVTEAEIKGLPEFKLEKIEKRNSKVVINTSYCSVSYGDVFPSELEVESKVEGDTAYLNFSAVIAGKKIPVYTLTFNTAEGIEVGTLALEGSRSPIRVGVTFYDAPISVSGDDLILFLAYSQSFGEIAASLNENQGFKAG